MATECFTPLRGVAARITELDECGAVPVDGVYVVSKGFITVNISMEVETGDEYIQKNADGFLCINERSPDELKRANVEIDWCRVDPSLISLITGNPEELETTDTVGFWTVAGPSTANYALEVWTRLAGGACADGGQCYGYLLIPWNTGSRVGDITVENGPVTFQTTGGYTVLPPAWGVGPWDVIGTPEAPTPLDAAAPDNGVFLTRTTCVPPPAESCGTAVIPSGS